MRKFRAPIITIALLIVALGPIGFHFVHAGPVSAVTDAVGNMIVKGFNTIVANLLYIPMVLASWLLWVGGVLLNYVLNYTVTNLSVNLRAITGIGVAWSTIRDLANMSFIFVLLYIAISTILGLSGSQWKKTLVSVVIAAILINFSMFFTEIIIDASNVITLGFYNQIVPDASVDKGLSDTIMQPLGLTSEWKLSSGSTLLQAMDNDLTRVAIVSIGSSIFMVITSFNFLAVSIIFLIRYVTLIFLIILSPIAFMGSVLPKLSSEANKWWKQLMGQAVFAPLYMLMTWVVITIIGNGFLCAPPSSSDGASGFADLMGKVAPANGSTGVVTAACQGKIGGGMGLVMNFVIIIAFIIGTLIIAKQTSEQAGSAAQKIVGGALGIGAGAAGYAGRRTIGSAARMVSDSESLKERASKGGVTGFGARLALQAGQKTASSSFDVRGISGAGKGLGIDGKAGGKGGYDAYSKAKADKMEKFGESLKPADHVLDEAKQKVEEARRISTDVSDAEYRQEYTKRKSAERAAQKSFDSAKADMDSYQNGVNAGINKPDPALFRYHKDLVDKRQAELNEAKRKTAVPVSGLKDDMKREREAAKIEKINQAKAEQENVEGVSEQEAEKRIRKTKAAEFRNNNPSWNQDEINKAVNNYVKDPTGTGEYQAELKRTTKKSAGDKRKEGYADVITQPGTINIPYVGKTTIGFNKIPFLGRTRTANRAAAAKLRKGKKPVKDQLEQIMRESGEISKTTEEGTTTSSTPVTGGASGGSAGGGGTTSGGGGGGTSAPSTSTTT